MGVDHPGLPMTMADLIRTIHRIAKATIQNASIGRAGIRVYDGGWIRIEDGGLSVTGTADVSGYLDITGRLQGSGNFAWSGPVNLTGVTTVTGPLTVDGSWDLNGNGEIRGNVTVLSGGRLKVGNMIIDPSGGGSISFPGGAVVDADPGGGVRMTQGTNRVYVGPGLVSLQYGSRTIAISASGQRMSGMPTTPSSLAGGASPGSVWSDTSGQLYRVVSG